MLVANHTFVRSQRLAPKKAMYTGENYINVGCTRRILWCTVVVAESEWRVTPDTGARPELNPLPTARRHEKGY